MPQNPAAEGDRAYRCPECGAEFPIDPSMPLDAHAAYDRHLDEHDPEPDAGPAEAVNE